LLLGEAKSYVIQIYKDFEKAGYVVQHFLLDASKMGVPQRRERVFFIALRKDLVSQFNNQVDMFTWMPKLDMVFKEPEIVWDNFETNDNNETLTSVRALKLWKEIKPGQDFSDHPDSNSGYGSIKLKRKTVFPTITSVFRPNSGTGLLHPEIARIMNKEEYCCGGTFPQDYNFHDTYGYTIGMSVPPVMTAQIATSIYDQWLSKITTQNK